MKEILKSVARFVELSKEFTTGSDEVYEGFKPHSSGSFSISAGTSYIVSSDSGYKLQVNPTPTKLEQYEQSLQKKYEKAKRYEEYLELQKALTEYFNSIEKLG